MRCIYDERWESLEERHRLGELIWIMIIMTILAQHIIDSKSDNMRPWHKTFDWQHVTVFAMIPFQPKLPFCISNHYTGHEHVELFTLTHLFKFEILFYMALYFNRIMMYYTRPSLNGKKLNTFTCKYSIEIESVKLIDMLSYENQFVY